MQRLTSGATVLPYWTDGHDLPVAPRDEEASVPHRVPGFFHAPLGDNLNRLSRRTLGQSPVVAIAQLYRHGPATIRRHV